MKNHNGLLIILFLAFLSSCEIVPWDCINGNGRIVIERRTISDFEAISSYGDYVVNYTKGPTVKLEVEGDENVLPYIETYISGNTLVIENTDNRCIRTNRPVEITVTGPGVSELNLYGSGLIECDSISTTELYANMFGSGKIDCGYINAGYLRTQMMGSGVIEAKGMATNTEHLLTGSGLIKTINLQQVECVGNISGSGNIYASVSDELSVTITGSGIFYYNGSPVIHQTITGSGSIRKY